jgi:hypothetical protein
MNAVCPNVIRTNISSPAFYDKLDAMGLLTPMEGVVEAFESMLGSNNTSGEIFEVCHGTIYHLWVGKLSLLF